MAIRKPIEHTKEVREAFERQFGNVNTSNGKASGDSADSESSNGK